MSKQSVEKRATLPEETMIFPSLQREMNRLFDQFRTGFPTSGNLTSSVFGTSGFPAIDVVDSGDALEVSAELPGVKEDELDVSISGEILTLKGEKTYDHEEKDEDFQRIERRFGSFRRHISLGFTPENDAVSAEFSDGVLKLKITKPATSKPKIHKIDIKKN